MGWSHATDELGREIGYSVDALCDEPGCDETIDRGLAYLCGNLSSVGTAWPEPGDGCAKYFCNHHLFMSRRDKGYFRCGSCLETDKDEDD